MPQELDCLVQIIRLTRHLNGDIVTVKTLIQEGLELVKSTDAHTDRIRILIEAAHAALAGGNDPEGFIDEIESIIKKEHLNVNPNDSLTLTILNDAVQAFREGKPLFRGDCLKHIPPGIRAWLVKTGQLTE